MHMLYHVLFRRMYTKLAKVYYRLRRRHNQTPSTIFSTAVTMSLFWAPKELSELPEMSFKVPFNLIGKLTTAFLTGQSQRIPSSETQGQIMEPRESLNGRENMARRKVKNGQKSRWGQCLTRPVPDGHRRSGFWLVPENFCVFLPNQKPEWRRPFGTGLVRHCPQGLFWPFFTFLRAIFSRPFRLSLALTICRWVSEDERILKSWYTGRYLILQFTSSKGDLQ